MSIATSCVCISISLTLQGWVNEEVVLKHAFPPAQDTRVLVCGLPGVHDKLCGSRESTELDPHSVLHKLQYTSDMVIKL